MLFAAPPSPGAAAMNRQSNQLLGGRPGGASQTNTLGGGIPGMPPTGGGQLTNKPNVVQIIQALMARGGAH